MNIPEIYRIYAEISESDLRKLNGGDAQAMRRGLQKVLDSCIQLGLLPEELLGQWRERCYLNGYEERMTHFVEQTAGELRAGMREDMEKILSEFRNQVSPVSVKAPWGDLQSGAVLPHPEQLHDSPAGGLPETGTDSTAVSLKAPWEQRYPDVMETSAGENAENPPELQDDDPMSVTEQAVRSRREEYERMAREAGLIEENTVSVSTEDAGEAEQKTVPEPHAVQDHGNSALMEVPQELRGQVGGTSAPLSAEDGESKAESRPDILSGTGSVSGGTAENKSVSAAPDLMSLMNDEPSAEKAVPAGPGMAEKQPKAEGSENNSEDPEDADDREPELSEEEELEMKKEQLSDDGDEGDRRSERTAEKGFMSRLSGLFRRKHND